MHYSKLTQKFYNDNNILFVPKDANPAAVPEDHGIERYWAKCKRKLKKEPKASTDDRSFKYRWDRAMLFLKGTSRTNPSGTDLRT